MRRTLYLRALPVVLTALLAPGASPAKAAAGDTWAYDSDGDGAPNAYYSDVNGDGAIDRFMMDDNENQRVEAWLDDRNYDGFLEHGSVDSNENGIVEGRAQRSPDNPDQWHWYYQDLNEDQCADNKQQWKCAEEGQEATVGGGSGHTDYWYEEQKAEANRGWLEENPDHDGDGWRNEHDRYPNDRRSR